MASKHLTDDEIQEYIDRRSMHASDDVVSHLESCPQCRERAEQYGRLYAGLRDDSGFDLPADFTSNVLDSIAVENRTPFWQRHFESLVAAAGLLMTLAAVAYFIDLTAVAKALMQFDLFGPLKDNTVAAGVKTRLTSSARFAMPLISGILAIAAVWLIDRLRIKSKGRISSLIA